MRPRLHPVIMVALVAARVGKTRLIDNTIVRA